jgi:hypothetical protein
MHSPVVQSQEGGAGMISFGQGLLGEPSSHREGMHAPCTSFHAGSLFNCRTSI